MCWVLHRVFDSSHCRSRYKSEDSFRPTASNVAHKFLDSAQLPSGASVSRNIRRKDRVCFSMSSVPLFPCLCFISNEAVLLTVPSTLCFFRTCSFLVYLRTLARQQQHTADTQQWETYLPQPKFQTIHKMATIYETHNRQPSNKSASLRASHNGNNASTDRILLLRLWKPMRLPSLTFLSGHTPSKNGARVHQTPRRHAT